MMATLPPHQRHQLRDRIAHRLDVEFRRQWPNLDVHETEWRNLAIEALAEIEIEAARPSDGHAQPMPDYDYGLYDLVAQLKRAADVRFAREQLLLWLHAEAVWKLQQHSCEATCTVDHYEEGIEGPWRQAQMDRQQQAAPMADLEERWCDGCQAMTSENHYHCANCGKKTSMMGHIGGCPPGPVTRAVWLARHDEHYRQSRDYGAGKTEAAAYADRKTEAELGPEPVQSDASREPRVWRHGADDNPDRPDPSTEQGMTVRNSTGHRWSLFGSQFRKNEKAVRWGFWGLLEAQGELIEVIKNDIPGVATPDRQAESSVQ